MRSVYYIAVNVFGLIYSRMEYILCDKVIYMIDRSFPLTWRHLFDFFFGDNTDYVSIFNISLFVNVRNNHYLSRHSYNM